MASSPAAAPMAIPTMAMLAAGVLSTLVLLGLPVLVGGMAEAFHWGDVERGWLASADMAGSAIASLIVFRWISHLDWRRATRAAAVISVAGNLASILAGSLGILWSLRFVTGLGNGVVLAIVFTGLCHSRDPDRYFGIYVLAQLVLQAALLAILPAVIAGPGLPYVYLMLAAAAVACAFLAALFPVGFASIRGLEKPATSPGDTAKSLPIRADAAVPRAVVALGAQAIYFLAAAAIWAYFEAIGRGFGLSLAQVGAALAASAFAGMAGSGAVIVIGARLPRVLLIAAGTIASICTVLLLAEGAGYLTFLVSACLFNFAWNYTFPYQMGVLAQLDRYGSVAVISLVVQLAGLAMGPAIAALLLTGDGYGQILYACGTCFLVSLVLFAWSGRS